MVSIASPVDHDLAGSGRRVTSPRRAILAAIGRRPAGFTAEEIGHLVPEVGRATVYRTLRLLLELGLVCRVMRENGSPRYRLSRPGHHHHVVCVNCGSVRDFDACTVSALMQELTRQTGFDAVGHWLEVYGRCPTCSAEPFAPTSTNPKPFPAEPINPKSKIQNPKS